MSIKLPVAANISLDNVSSKSIVLQSHPSSYELLQQGDCDEWLHITSETTWSGMKKSWKSTVAVGAVTAGIVLLVNLGFLVYMISRRGFGIASFTLYTGSCDRTKWITLWLDLLINILSTLLLGAANNCAQLLSSPERADVDRAHTSGTWLDIGVPSVRNLRHIDRTRSVLWLVLFVTSIPLHLFYNSVIYSQTNTNDYLAVLVTEDFVSGGYWNYTDVPDGYWNWTGAPKDSIIEAQIIDLKFEAQNDRLQRLDSKTCLEDYSTAVLHSGWASVLIVTNVTQRKHLVVPVTYQTFTPNEWPNWLCNMTGEPGDPPCDMSALATAWQIANVPGQSDVVAVNYCLAKPFPNSQCMIKASSTLLLVVIVCNLLKLGCLVYVFCHSSFEPLATIGDAISSFLRSPDDTTKGLGLLDGFHMRKGLAPDTRWDPKTKRWGTISGTSRLTISLILCSLIWIAGIILLVVIYEAGVGSMAYVWAEGIGSFSAENTIEPSAGSPLLSNVLLANTPQLVVSMAYICYNNVFTCMLLGREISAFAIKRKPLRTTAPRGHQHSTYWLQLPFRFSAPMMISMALLHWLISRSIFLLEVGVYGINGQLDPFRTVNACGYAGQPVILALILGLVMIAFLVGFGWRKLTPGIPAMGNCSIAISAACHANPQEKRLEVLPLQYGVIPAFGRDGDRGEHVGFSSREVLPLVPFQPYY